MSHALSQHDEQVIDRLIRDGFFASRSEVLRAGLRELEQKYRSENYLNPPSLPEGTLASIYRKQSGGRLETE
jgi:Arc/MetJ-type ribon-helix-helix transcriptional regulator